jgi:ABC-2 type transport system permease protein
MTLWRTEWMRLTRTGRWIALVAVFLLLGLSGPLATHYLGQLLAGSTGGTYIRITVSRPRPSDGMSAYFSNITLLGTLVCVIVAGLAFSVRAVPPLAALYLTHVPSRIRLLSPRLVVVSAAVLVTTFLGGAAAAYETALLIGTPSTGATVTGVVLSGLAGVFAVAVTFLCATLLRGQVATIAVAIVVIFVGVPFADLVPGVRHVGPNAFTNLPMLLQTTAWTTDDAWSTVVTLALTTACVIAGLLRARRWQL